MREAILVYLWFLLIAMTNLPPVVVALDGMNETQAISLARRLEGLVWGFKINDLLLRADVQLVFRLRHYGRVFCDAKLHDIPNTVANQVRVLTEAGTDMITLHISGGANMLKAATIAATSFSTTDKSNPMLIGVSILTSLDNAAVQQLYGASIKEVVQRLALESLDNGLAGIVCAATELPLINEVDPHHQLQRIVPGIRFDDGSICSDDQQRRATPAYAWQAGADWLVVGRPITTSPDPAEICNRLAVVWNQVKREK